MVTNDKIRRAQVLNIACELKNHLTTAKLCFFPKIRHQFSSGVFLLMEHIIGSISVNINTITLLDSWHCPKMLDKETKIFYRFFKTTPSFTPSFRLHPRCSQGEVQVKSRIKGLGLVIVFLQSLVLWFYIFDNKASIVR